MRNGRAVGIDVGGTKLLAIAIDAEGEIMAEQRARSPREGPALIEAIATLAEAVGPVGGLAVGLPGLVQHGVLRFAANLPGIVELPAANLLEARLGAPVVLSNDATLAAWGEHARGAAVGVDDALVVTLGTGIGGGLILGGRLYEGAHGMAGEIGHVLIDPLGPPCACGQRGCWERYASGSALGRFGGVAAEAGRAPVLLAAAGGDPTSVRGEHVVSAARNGDEAALAVVEEFAGWVAVGLANLVNIFDPALIVLGGGLAEAGDVLLAPVQER
ncbi:MAG TPA: ROK family protein, partial [Acidimicrobiales bacterium]|nr:ROK family protein [Acidimicrobiales bacterium]